MRRIYVAACLLFLLTACAETAPESVVVPTLAELPTLTPSATPTATLTPSLTPTLTVTLTETATATASRTPRPSATIAASATITPSATITDTPTATFTASPTAETQLGSLAELALTASAATLLPPTLRPPAATPIQLTVAAPGVTSIAPTFTPLALAPITCPWSTPPVLENMLAADPALSNALGCASGTPARFAGAAQVFQSGTMYYLDGAPRSIYVLTIDGHYRRFDDTWVQGVDPDSAGEIPPPGLIEPIRGFGKVWRTNADVRASLGWAITNEMGDTATVEYFERGRAIYLPVRGETIILAEDPGGQSGVWRAISGGF